MYSYTILFSLKENFEEERINHLALEFGDKLVREDIITSYNFGRSASRQHPLKMTAFFRDQAHLEKGFSLVREFHLTSHPHGELMESVASFKVEFGAQDA